MGRWREAPEGLNRTPFQVTVSVPFMGRWREAPEGQTRTPFQVTVSVPFMLRWREAPEGQTRTPFQVTVTVPFMPEQVLPIHGEVARSAGGADSNPFSCHGPASPSS